MPVIAVRSNRHQDRAKAFYVDKLGLRLVREDDSVPGLRWIQVAPVDGGAELTLVTWSNGYHPAACKGSS